MFFISAAQNLRGHKHIFMFSKLPFVKLLAPGQPYLKEDSFQMYQNASYQYGLYRTLVPDLQQRKLSFVSSCLGKTQTHLEQESAVVWVPRRQCEEHGSFGVELLTADRRDRHVGTSWSGHQWHSFVLCCMLTHRQDKPTLP